MQKESLIGFLLVKKMVNKNNLWKKATWIYNDWLMHYKGKSVNDITLSEHKKWSEEFRKWKKGNIEKV